MASGKSARRLLQFFKTTDAPTISAWSEALVGQLDNDVEGGQGTLAARPAASLRGRIYVVQGDATAENNGIVWWDTGATWIAVNRPADGQVYGTPTDRASGAENEPSALRSTQVIVYPLGVTKILEVLVGGVIIPFRNGGDPFSFICPPGKKWKAVIETGVSFKSIYLPL